MNYKRLTNEELQEYKYPNLKAEIIESGYSMRTICEHMGHERMNDEDALKIINAKFTGEEVITTDEAFGLAGLFRGDVEYLISTTLTIEYEKPKAYWRWLVENQRKAEALKQVEEWSAIERELREKPYLLQFIKQCIGLSKDQREQVLQLLKEMKKGPDGV